MFDTHDEVVEIKITRDPKHGHRVWIHVGPELAVRVYRATVILDGVRLPKKRRARDNGDDGDDNDGET
jgi:hypothetical protein